MGAALVDVAEPFLTSPCVYAVVVLFVAVDAVVPMVPGETVVIAAAVFAVNQPTPVLALVALTCAAAVGAVSGDTLGYELGRRLDTRLRHRLRGSPRRRAAFAAAERALRERGGQLLVMARFLPGGRTMTTLTAGAVGHPRRSFQACVGAAGLLWAVYVVLLGCLGGTAYRHDPLRGVLLGLGVAVGITVVAEAVRLVRRHRRRRHERRLVEGGPVVTPAGDQ